MSQNTVHMSRICEQVTSAIQHILHVHGFSWFVTSGSVNEFFCHGFDLNIG